MFNAIKLLFKEIAYPFLIILILIIISFLTYLISPSLSGYLTITAFYLILIGFSFYYLNYSKIKERKNKSLFAWLDILDGNNEFLENLYSHKKVEKDLLINLNTVYDAVLNYTERDIKKLRLLKVYFKSINNESPIDLFAKVFITFLFGIFAANLSNGKILSHFKGVSPLALDISSTYLTVLNLIMLFFMFLIGVTFILSELFIGKKRTKFIEEVLEMCIKEVEE